MNIFTFLRFCALVLCSFIFTPSHAQKEEDYFITVWDLSLDSSRNNSIQFYSRTSGGVDYMWETIPAGQSGSGKFVPDDSTVIISNLPLKAVIQLKLAPQNLKRFFSDWLYPNKQLINVMQWGTTKWRSMEDAFSNCVNLTITATDVPNLTNIKSMSGMFSRCNKFVGTSNMSNWVIDSVVNMSHMFYGANSFDAPIGNWNTQNVTNMAAMFNFATVFNRDISKWNTQNVEHMWYMFSEARSFNQPIGNWDTKNVKYMTSMFLFTDSFNQPIGNWNTQKVEDMSYMFKEAIAFNQPIGNWDTRRVVDMRHMFSYAKSFNQPIGNWNTGNVSNMHNMFSEAPAFNQALGNWDTKNVTDMGFMFYNANSFNQPIGNWNIENVVDISFMFTSADLFNQPIGNWNTKSVNDMRFMFAWTDFFNQSIENWKTENVTDMSYMFQSSKAFNQPLSNWNTQNVTNMSGMFRKAASFNQSLAGWQTKNALSMDAMFFNASSFNQRLDILELNPLLNFTGSDIEGFLDFSAIDCKNYSSTLIGWANNPNTPANKKLGAKRLKYGLLSTDARAKLTKPVAEGGLGWTITGDAPASGDCDLNSAEDQATSHSTISLYPNPAQDKLFLKNAEANTAYKIIDNLGRTITSGICQNEEITIVALPAGLYKLVCGNRYFTFVKE